MARVVGEPVYICQKTTQKGGSSRRQENDTQASSLCICSDIQESLAATADREDTIGSPQVLLSTSRWLDTDEPCFRKRRYWKEVEDTISPNIAEPHSMNCHLTVHYANNLRGRLEHGCSVSGRERMGLGDTTTNSGHRTSDLECYISA